jgi:hypothetical protein
MMRGAMVRPMSLRLAALVVATLPLAVAGCADWPDVADPPGVAGAPDPRIAPLPGLPGPAVAETAALEEETRLLQARAAGLRNRAATIGQEP